MTSFVRGGGRRTPVVSGPEQLAVRDIPGLNAVFSNAFTDRYRKDGLVGVHVPNLSPAIWRFAIEDAAGGGMLWRGERGEPIAFNVCHLSGTEGWMGPLAVSPDHQGHGFGKVVVGEGTSWLIGQGARVIGLETMPRTVDNIGFYSGLGYRPGHLTITVTVEGAYAEHRVTQLGRLSERERDDIIDGCLSLTSEIAPGYDYSREIRLTQELGLGDTIVLERDGAVAAFALCHTAPLVEGRARDELRLLKLVARDEDDVMLIVTQLADFARRASTRRVAIRIQTTHSRLYARLVNSGARVRWTDLRMTLEGFAEPARENGIVLSNWEI